MEYGHEKIIDKVGQRYMDKEEELNTDIIVMKENLKQKVPMSDIEEMEVNTDKRKKQKKM